MGQVRANLQREEVAKANPPIRVEVVVQARVRCWKCILDLVGFGPLVTGFHRCEQTLHRWGSQVATHPKIREWCDSDRWRPLEKEGLQNRLLIGKSRLFQSEYQPTAHGVVLRFDGG